MQVAGERLFTNNGPVLVKESDKLQLSYLIIYQLYFKAYAYTRQPHYQRLL